MTSQVTLPLWLALLIGALAIWAAFERIVVPAVRYLMRRRLNRAIDELNTKLKLRIQPLKLAKRQALIDQLIFDPEVLRAIEAYAAENKVSREAAQARARDYAKEIVPSFSAYAYFGIGARLARWALDVSLPRAARIPRRAGDADGRSRRRRDLRDQSPLQHGLRAGHLHGVQFVGALLCGRRMGARVAAAEPDPHDGRLFRAPRLARAALSQGALALRSSRDRGRAHAGHVSGRRADARRQAAPAQAGSAQLHRLRLRPAWAARCRVRAGRPQLRPRAGRPHPGRRAGNARGRETAF